jgi:hypothetical protein
MCSFSTNYGAFRNAKQVCYMRLIHVVMLQQRILSPGALLGTTYHAEGCEPVLALYTAFVPSLFLQHWK